MKHSTKAAVFTAALLAFGAYHYTSTGSPEPVDASSLHGKLADLDIQPERAEQSYDRDDWPHWSSVGEGCNTRDAVLLDQADVEPGEGCEIPDATWVSEFDEVTVADPSGLDIDHVVPLAEAHRSGAHTWSEARREEFANDTRFLVAVTASSNREKGDQDPADWMPPNTDYHCKYTEIWVSAKHAYGLSVDQSEHDALTRVLDTCEGV